MKDAFANYDSWKTDYSSTVIENDGDGDQFEGHACGIPCLIAFNGDPDEYILSDTRGRVAPWLQRKVQQGPKKWHYEIVSQIEEYLESQYWEQQRKANEYCP